MNDIETLQKLVKEQEKQLKALKQAIDMLIRRSTDTDKRARRNSEGLRRITNDINTIKRNLRG